MSSVSNSRMTAVVCHGPEDYRVEQVERPIAGPRELVIQITACGICASDCKCWSGAKMFWGGEAPLGQGARHPGPRVLRRGRRDRRGRGRAFRRQGRRPRHRRADRALRHVPLLPVRQILDVRGPQHLRLPARGRRRRHGGIHEAARRPRACTRIPPSIVARRCGHHRAAGLRHPHGQPRRHPARRRGGDRRRRAARPDDGAGRPSQDAEEARRHRPGGGAAASSPSASAPTSSINPQRERAGEVVRGLTEGYGCDVYIEATGAPIGVTQGLDLIRKLGRFVEFSVFGKETSVDWSIIGDRKELDVRGVASRPLLLSDRDRPARARPRDLEGHRHPRIRLEDWDEAIKVANSLDSIKVLLKPSRVSRS